MKKKLFMTLLVLALFISEMAEQNARLIVPTRVSFSSYTEYSSKFDTHSQRKSSIYPLNGVIVYGILNITPIDMSKYTGVATLATLLTVT